jgi:hypothetical protein
MTSGYNCTVVLNYQICSTVNKSTYATAIRNAIVDQMANDTEQVDQRNMVHA